MTLFERVHVPSFAGATEWLNSEPLGPAELEGHIVLANFWTLTASTGCARSVLRDGRLYQLVRQHDTVRQRTLRITFLQPGAKAYSFTFG
jgi:hypothetical protein